MVDIQAKKLEYYSEGVLGRTAATLRFIHALETRRAAKHAVAFKNAIEELKPVLDALIAEHRLERVRETAQEIINALGDGLQNTYNVMFAEMLLLKEELLEAVLFLKKWGGGMTENEVALYGKFIEETSETLKLFDGYINELIAACQEKEISYAPLGRQAEAYSIKGIVNIVRPFLEGWSMRSLTKATFKLEQRLKNKEERSKESGKDVSQILQMEKAFNQDVRELLTKMSIFTLILIRDGHHSANQIVKATEEGHWDLPAAFSDFGWAMINITDDEVNALKSLKKSVNQLQNVAKKAEEALATARRQSAKQERKEPEAKETRELVRA
jgi:hypothetical protein